MSNKDIIQEGVSPDIMPGMPLTKAEKGTGFCERHADFAVGSQSGSKPDDEDKALSETGNRQESQ